MGQITFFDDEIHECKGDSNFMFYAIMTFIVLSLVVLIAGSIIRQNHFRALDAQACSLDAVVCKGEAN